MYCTNCGSGNPDGNKFCQVCGRALAAPGSSTNPPPSASPIPASTRPSDRSSRLPLILGGVAVLAVLAVAAWFLLPRLAGGSKQMLLTAPDRNGSYTLSVLRLGDEPKKAVKIVDNIYMDSNEGRLLIAGGMNIDDSSATGGDFGGFLPDGRLIASYSEGGELRMMEYASGEDAPIEILSSSTNELFGIYLPAAKKLLLIEVGSNWRCYMSRAGRKAERVARGDMCLPTADQKHVVAEKTNNSGELTVTVTDLDGKNEVILLDDAADTSGSYRVSADASHIAYEIRDGGGARVIVLLDDAGEELFRTGEFAQIGEYGFAGMTDTFYYTGLDGDSWGLYTINGLLIEAPVLSVLAVPDDKWLIARTADEGGAGEISAINLQDGQVTEISSGDNLGMMITAEPARLVIQEANDDDLRLTVADLSGENPAALFSDSGYTLYSIIQPPGDKRLFLSLSGEDGSSLFVAPIDGSAGFFVLEDWYDFRPLNLSGDTLLLAGREDDGDDEILFAVTLEPKAVLVELDDSADGYVNAVVGADGRTALYTAIIGDRPDDVVVRRTRLNGKDKPEDLYDKNFLAAASWAEIAQFVDYFNESHFR